MRLHPEEAGLTAGKGVGVIPLAVIGSTPVFKEALHPMVLPVCGQKFLVQDEAREEFPQLTKDAGGAVPGRMLRRVEVDKRSGQNDHSRLIILNSLQLLGQVDLTEAETRGQFVILQVTGQVDEGQVGGGRDCGLTVLDTSVRHV